MSVKDKSISFRSWFYFRTGWSVYFAFIFAAINTLVVTYYLAIENIPFLQEIFPTFAHYVIVTVVVGIPVLIGAGYIHFKRSQGFKAECDVRIETQPHQKRILTNTEGLALITYKINSILIKKLSNQESTDNDVKEILDLKKKIEEHKIDRTFSTDLFNDIDKILEKKV